MVLYNSRIAVVMLCVFLTLAHSGCKDDKLSKENNPTSTLTDADGNEYVTVTINEVEWMAENLKTTSYSDGSTIPYVGDDPVEWGVRNLGAYSWYRNEMGNNETFGGLYNWYAVNSGRLCPVGWRVATDSDWADLVNYIDDKAKDSIVGIVSSVAGGHLKKTGTSYWESPNKGATDLVGFSALPGGYRNHTGGFGYINKTGVWWIGDYEPVDSLICPVYWFVGYKDGDIQRLTNSPNMGMSVRCVKE